jgi:membrane fusion protein, multidrug efflux system
VEESKGKDEKVALVAQQKFVTTGETRGDQVAILSGIKEGDTVVTAGQIKLRSGFPVIVNNSIQPTNDPSPQPKDQ